MAATTVFEIERPHRKLLALYVIRSVLSGPAILFLLPFLYFRYRTMRFRFDEQGVHMRWGILFRREVNLTYARIQDIHLRSGVLQRWLGLADVLVQTAAGSAGAEMTIEGLLQYEQVRDFLYVRMRGHREDLADAPAHAAAAEDGVAGALLSVAQELRLTREALERMTAGGAEVGEEG